MKKIRAAHQWLEAAQSVFLKAKAGFGKEGIRYEDLCYDLFQAAERALMAFFSLLGLISPPVQGIEVMLVHLSLNGVSFPEWMQELIRLDRYSAISKWPWFQNPLQKTDYWEALDLTERLMEWIEEEIEKAERP